MTFCVSLYVYVCLLNISTHTVFSTDSLSDGNLPVIILTPPWKGALIKERHVESVSQGNKQEISRSAFFFFFAERKGPFHPSSGPKS